MNIKSEVTQQLKYQRKKQERPEEIASAALEEFAEKGYSATRIQDVAKRAGISKGLMYLYYKTKEELFKAVIKNMIAPRVDALDELVETTELSAEEILRGPFLKFAEDIGNSPVKRLAPLLIAESRNHPDLIDYYWENVVQHALHALRTVIKKGVEDGDFQHSILDEQPHLIASPVIFSVLWNSIFGHKQELDPKRVVAAQLEMIILTLKSKDLPKTLL